MHVSTHVIDLQKDPLEHLPTTFSALRHEMERFAGFKQILLQSLAEGALAAEDQLKSAVAAAEEAGKQTLIELRAKYLKEVEIAVAERDIMEHRLQTATRQFEQRETSWAAKLAESEQGLSTLQDGFHQAQTEREQLEA